MFASGIAWFLLPALVSVPVASLTLFYLALSTDADGRRVARCAG